MGLKVNTVSSLSRLGTVGTRTPAQSRVRMRVGWPYPVLLFAVLSLGVGTWFSARLPIGFGDAGLLEAFYNPRYLAALSSFAWNPAYSGGQPSPQDIASVPVACFFALLGTLHFPPFARQAVYFSLIQFSSLYFMHLFMRRAFDNDSGMSRVAVLGALLYTFNPLVMTDYWYNGFMVQPILAFVPCALFLAELSLRVRPVYCCLASSLAVCAFSITFLNPAYILPVFFLVVFYWLFRSIQLSSSLRVFMAHSRDAAVIAVACFFVGSWMFLPLVSSITSYYSSAMGNEDPISTLHAASTFTSLTSVLRLVLYRSQAGIWGYMNPAWRFVYDQPIFILIGIGASILGVIPFARRKATITMCFWGAVWLLGVFLSLGTNQPLSGLFSFLFNHVPYFRSFRSPSGKFLPLLVVPSSILIAIGVFQTGEQIRRHFGSFASNAFAAACALVLCGLYVYPMWNGAVINTPVTGHGAATTPEFNVPAYYETVASFLAHSDDELRSLALPIRPSVYVTFDWGRGYDGGDPTWLLLRRPVISSAAAGLGDAGRLLQQASREDIRSLIETSGLLSTKYVIVQGDVDSAHGEYGGEVLPSVAQLRDSLSGLGMPLEYVAGPLSLYRMPPGATVAPVIAVDPDISQVNSISGMLTSLFLPSMQFTGKAVTLDGQNSGTIANWPRRGAPFSQPASIRSTQVNPSKIVSIVEGARQPFLLVLSSNYDPKWRAFVQPVGRPIDASRVRGSIFGLSGFDFTPGDAGLLNDVAVPNSLHVEVDGFANAWYIDPSPYGSDFKVVMYYSTQTYTYLGIVCSLFVLSFLLVCATVYTGLKWNPRGQ